MEKQDIRPKDEQSIGNNVGCPFWFFGDEQSADKDLEGKVEVTDD